MFQFHCPTRIRFGSGILDDAVSDIARFGRRVLLLSGSDFSRIESVYGMLQHKGLSVVHAEVNREPAAETVLACVDQGVGNACDCVVAVGGGSVIDAGKAVSALMTNRKNVFEYLEVVGEGKPLTRRPAPLVAIPTTAGSGAEVTRNAVLTVQEHRVKVSLRSDLLFPNLAIVDPELTRSMPPNITANTGMDAFVQVVEPYVSLKANPYTDAVCRDAVARAVRWLKIAFENGDDMTARENMSLVSLSGGIALSNSGLGAVHGFAAPVGGMFEIPHGAVCARLLPHVAAANIRALKQRSPDSLILARYAELAAMMTGNPDATPEAGTDWIHRLLDDLKVPPLSDFGVTPDAFHTIAEKAAASSSMKANPVVLTPEELVGVLESESMN